MLPERLFQEPQTGGRQWMAESWRLTAFLEPTATPSHIDWWARVTGSDPDTRASNPKIGSSQDQGYYAGGMLTLGVAPGRVDWLYASERLLQQEAAPDGTDTLGTATETLEPFRLIASRWLPLSPPVVRLAMGAVLLKPV